MSPIKPLNSITAATQSSALDRAQRRQTLLSTDANETANAERNARATESESRRSRPNSSGDGRGSTIDIVS